MPAPGRGDVGGEAVVGAVEPALGEVAVADRRPRHLAARGAGGRPGRSCRRSVSGSSLPSQLRSRSIALRSRWPRGLQAAEPRAPPRGRGSRGRRSASPRSSSRSCSSLSREQLLDPPGAVAVEPVAGDVVRVVVADDPVVGGDEEAALGVDDLRQLLVGDDPLPLELAGPARLRQVGAVAAAERQAADQLVADRAVAVGPDQVRGRRGVALEAAHELRRRRSTVERARTCRRRRSIRRASASAGRAARPRRRRAPR